MDLLALFLDAEKDLRAVRRLDPTLGYLYTFRFPSVENLAAWARDLETRRTRGTGRDRQRELTRSAANRFDITGKNDRRRVLIDRLGDWISKHSPTISRVCDELHELASIHRATQREPQDCTIADQHRRTTSFEHNVLDRAASLRVPVHLPARDVEGLDIPWCLHQAYDLGVDDNSSSTTITKWRS